MPDISTFRNKWINSRVDYDRVYAYQCVDLILQYIYELYGLPSGVRGNAIDYWTKPSAALLTKFDKVQTSDAQAGDIVVLNGLKGNPYGHIGIATGHKDASQVEILEQNGSSGNGSGQGGDAVRVRMIARSRIAGCLRPKASAPTVTPVAAPAPTQNVVHLPKHVKTWALYHIGTALRKGTTDQKATICPAEFGGLTYPIVAWVGDYGVVIDTQMFGRGVIWVKGTDAQFYSRQQVGGLGADAAASVYLYERLANPLNVITNRDDAELWDLTTTDAEGNGVRPLVSLPKGTPFTAVGKATNQLDPDHPVYYMSNESFGDADVSGKPTHDQGVKTTDLAPGQAPAPAPTPPAAPYVPELPAVDGDKIQVKVLAPNPDAWKSTFKTNMAGDYVAKSATIIHDLEDDVTKRVADLPLVQGAPVEVAGTFEKNDIKYYRTVRSAEGWVDKDGVAHPPNWRGIPIECLDEDDSVFTYQDDDIDGFKDLKGDVTARRKAIKVAAAADGKALQLLDRFKKRK